MKMNKNELQIMINQIDEELLNEANNDYGTRNSLILRRIVPVAACVILLISATAAAVLKNGISVDSVQKAAKGTAETIVRSQEEKNSYTIEAENQQITQMLTQIDNFLQGKELSSDVVVSSVNMKINPKNLDISSGTIILTDRALMNHITVDIFEKYITVSIQHDSGGVSTWETVASETGFLDSQTSSETSEEEADYAETEYSEMDAEVSEVSELFWADLCKLSENFELAVILFSEEEYVTVTEASIEVLSAHTEDCRYVALEAGILNVFSGDTGLDEMRSRIDHSQAGLFLNGRTGEDPLITENNLMVLVR